LGSEEFKAYLLAAFAGLRRDENDKLQWRAFRWESGILRLEVTEHFGGKSEESVADVDLEEEVLAIFRGFHAQARGPFVIESTIPPRRTTTYRHYRAQRTFDKLCGWLRAHGVASTNPLHTLRKEFDSQVADKLGIYAASRALRHADIKITAAHYLEGKRRIVPGLGSLLKQPDNITTWRPNRLKNCQPQTHRDASKRSDGSRSLTPSHWHSSRQKPLFRSRPRRLHRFAP
jgi:hypothetical protein